MNTSENLVDIRMNINVNYILTCLFVLIAIVGILGNILVILSVRLDSQMKQSLTNRLIVHVACCDLIILLFNIPDIIQFVSSTNGNWILSEISCKLIRSILVLAQYASVLTMCAVTIERFIGIVYPLRSKFLSENKHVTQLTFIVWIFSLICVSPNLIYLRVLTMPSSRRSCHLQYSWKSQIENRHGYIIHKSIESTIFYFLPLLLQLYCYTRIAIQLSHVDDALRTSLHRKKKQNIHRTQNGIEDEDDYVDNDERKFSIDNSDGNFSTVPTSLSINNKPRLSILKNVPEGRDYYRSRATYNALKSRRSVIKMLAVVVLIYFVSFSPQVLVFILFDTNAIQSAPKFIQTPYFIAFTMILVTISSASNPIVYVIFCSKFRQSFAKILRYLWICGRPIFYCHTDQRSRSLQQIPKRTYHFTGTMINNERKQSINKNISFQINENNRIRK